LDRKLRAVIDTNLFISGIFGKESLSVKLQDLWIEQEFELATSMEILKEVSRVLQYPRIKQRFHPKEKTIKRFFNLIFRKAIITKDLYKAYKIVDDPTDNKFLACALEAKADYIISRDPHLRNLKHFHGIKIVDVKEFMGLVTKKRGPE
jgi:putative PIN family toxin of toxin-antitoxin system